MNRFIQHEIHKSFKKALQSPSHSHGFGGTIAGDDGDETRVVCVLEKREKGFKSKEALFLVTIYQFDSYSEDETDGSHPGGGHDFGTVGDQVEQDGHGGLGSMVEAAAEHR